MKKRQSVRISADLTDRILKICHSAMANDPGVARLIQQARTLGADIDSILEVSVTVTPERNPENTRVAGGTIHLADLVTPGPLALNRPDTKFLKSYKVQV